MAEEKEPSKRELIDALAKANEAIAELRAAQVRTPPPQPAPQARPYSGMVRAKEACYIDYLRKAGDVWHHETKCLWSDDPYEPVIVTGNRDDGTPIAEPHPEAPEPVPFHLRPRSADALAAIAATPQRADKW